MGRLFHPESRSAAFRIDASVTGSASSSPAFGPVAAALALCLGCEIEVGLGRDDDLERRVVLDAPVQRKHELDLLFVVDNSSEMDQRQFELATSFEHLVPALIGPDGELPDLHIGVISTDLGSGPFASPHTSCGADGDQARLLTESKQLECENIEGRYLLRLNAGGEVLTNYGGGLEDSFQCMAVLGSGGCDYEQPLEAMRRALDGSVAENAGFLRPDAVLGVIFLTDEDDCSARVPDLFDPDNADLPGDSSPEWRCFISGVTCSGVDDVFPPGWQEGCEPREDSPYVAGVWEYVRFLEALKPDPNHLVVSGIIGDPNLVNVEIEIDSSPSLAPACVDDGGVAAYPGIRMRHFFDGFRGRTRYESLCGGDRPMGVLTSIADDLRRAMGSTCLAGELLDSDPVAAGTQVDCDVYHIWADRQRERIIACDRPYDPTASSSFPCYTIVPGNDACSHEPTRLSLRVYYSATYDPDDRRHEVPDLPGARVTAECLVRP
jgi:hypothetical protein